MIKSLPKSSCWKVVKELSFLKENMIAKLDRSKINLILKNSFAALFIFSGRKTKKAFKFFCKKEKQKYFRKWCIYLSEQKKDKCRTKYVYSIYGHIYPLSLATCFMTCFTMFSTYIYIYLD